MLILQNVLSSFNNVGIHAMNLEYIFTLTLLKKNYFTRSTKSVNSFAKCSSI